MSMHEAMFGAYGTPMLNGQFGVSITTERGGVTSEPFTARRSDYESKVESPHGAHQKAVMRDYRFATEDYVLDGQVVTPQTGDQLADGDDTFEIMPIANEPAVQPQLSGAEWRVLTKKVG